MHYYTAQLTARMILKGISRQEAARRACLSYSAFNRKLRENRLTEEEWERIMLSAEGREKIDG